MMPARTPIMIREDRTQRTPPPEWSYPAEKARGGEIILSTPLKRGLFVAAARDMAPLKR
jgi:hypothetical protein